MIFLGTFLEISSSDIASTTGYAKSLVGDFMPIIVLILGILIGVFILRVLMSLK